MKNYLNPKLEVLELDVIDVLTSSGVAIDPPTGGGANDTPPVSIPIHRE